MKETNVLSIEEYIDSFPKATQKLLKQMHALIRTLVPEAEETISYRMPAFKFHGMLVYFAGYERHIGFYPGTSGIANFKNEIAGYKNAKGSVQFPLDKPLPIALITKIVKFRVKENLSKSKKKN